VLTCVLHPLSGAEGDWVEHVPDSNRGSPQRFTSAPESASYDFVSLPDDPEDPSGIPLEAHRELRIKLFIGEVVRFLYISGRRRTHLPFTGRSRMGVAHTCVPHITRFAVI
jgi:hypothetical protein